MVGGGFGFFPRVFGSSVFALGGAVVSGGSGAASGAITPLGLCELVLGAFEGSAFEFGTVCVFGLNVSLLGVFCLSAVASPVFAVDGVFEGAGFACGDVCALELLDCGIFWAKLAELTRISKPTDKVVRMILFIADALLVF
jgi:hypothetical protein